MSALNKTSVILTFPFLCFEQSYDEMGVKKGEENDYQMFKDVVSLIHGGYWCGNRKTGYEDHPGQYKVQMKNTGQCKTNTILIVTFSKDVISIEIPLWVSKVCDDNCLNTR